MAIDGTHQGRFSCKLKQAVGSDFQKEQVLEPFEYSPSYRGPFNHVKFAAGLTHFYRQTVSASGNAMIVAENCGTVNVSNSRHDFGNSGFKFEADPNTFGWS